MKLDLLSGHGGLFKTKDVGLKMMTAAAGVPVSVLETAGQGGAWGIALLAAYMLEHKEGETLSEYLDQRILPARNRPKRLRIRRMWKVLPDSWNISERDFPLSGRQ